MPTARRKLTLEAHLKAQGAISSGLFTIITLDELEGLVQAGPTAGVASPDGVENAT